MGLATVFVVPSKAEPAVWLPIFVVCALVIARMTPSQRFQHGLYLGLVNSLWITAVHVVLYDQYLASHPSEAALMANMAAIGSAKFTLVVTGPMFGLISGAILGVFTLIAGVFVQPPESAVTPRSEAKAA